MMSQSVFLLMMLVFSSAGGNELLDYVPTDAYWQVKGLEPTTQALLDRVGDPDRAADVRDVIQDLRSQDEAVRAAAHKRLVAAGPAVIPKLKALLDGADAELAARVRAIVKDVGTKGKTGAVMRLMAIRTLGERRCRPAVGALKELLDANEPFVADYARRAIASIAGKPVERAAPDAKTLARDVWMLPANCGLVGQMVTAVGERTPMAKVVEKAGPLPGGAEPEQVLRQVAGMVLSAAERVGNIRLDAVTFAVADDVGEESGFLVIAARGLYDRAAVRQALLDVMPGGLEAFDVDGVEVLGGDDSGAMIPASDRLFLLAAAPNRQRMPLAHLASVIKQRGKTARSLAANAAMAKLIKGTDTAKPIWAVARMSAAYRAAEVLAPFDSARLLGQIRRGRCRLSVKATGRDADAVAASVSKIKAEVAEARKELAREAERVPMLRTIRDLAESIQVEAKGATATLTAELKGASPATLLPMVFLWTYSAGPRAAEPDDSMPPPAAGAPAPAPAPR
jgi:hypothetical protein